MTVSHFYKSFIKQYTNTKPDSTDKPEKFSIDRATVPLLTQLALI